MALLMACSGLSRPRAIICAIVTLGFGEVSNYLQTIYNFNHKRATGAQRSQTVQRIYGGLGAFCFLTVFCTISV